jgi:hypothetical protein
MTITEITTHHDQAKPCPLRDIAEPVDFTVNVRLRVVISRLKSAKPITAERLAQMVADALANAGITVAP